MSHSLKEEKKQLRKSIKETLGKIDEQNVKEQSDAVTQKVLQLPQYQKASAISVFLSMPGREVSTSAIVTDALGQGKKVFIPYIHPETDSGKSKIMDMLRLKDESDQQNLKPDAWGIPSLSAEGIEERENALGGRGISDAGHRGHSSVELDLIFMPGMAFDSANNRLGHGKGFYDRYLSRIRENIGRGEAPARFPVLIALALREQLLPPMEQVPASDDDWKIDRLVIPD
ncbi:hypothetical protein LTR70_006502 [Exophiala xenobiotica]|uniref:5-formyltetrahydrofolate cyclo-ligase n=1 Tax=Lithohypha guttulata TaxID=1690604 RepID=A0ABR0JZK6_9EURO|nr:hypothetical protein LTR24_009211 [Lithohypha guttulata]KAK5315950.1 hypothetical protein LTR70_006502 [Exophiala xenobiotica]